MSLAALCLPTQRLRYKALTIFIFATHTLQSLVQNTHIIGGLLYLSCSHIMLPKRRVAATAALLAIANCNGFAPSIATSRALQTDTSSSLYFLNKADDDDNEASSTTAKEEEASATNFFSKHAPAIKVALPSFLLGGIATLSFLFGPVLTDYYDAFSPSPNANSYSAATSSKNINQPVILFETILNDLNEAYVDDVDVQKLFETGIKAMTSSLDPYTEFESQSEARDLEESVTGAYGGVGLVIRGSTSVGLSMEEDVLLSPPSSSSDDSKASSSPVVTNIDEKRKLKRQSDGIRVVSAFEGYAYDAGLRVGDKLLSIDDYVIEPSTTVEQVRNHLRGKPGTSVSITFEREGVGTTKDGAVVRQQQPQTISMERSVVHIPDVKYYGFIGDPADGIGYIDLSGFANDAGREVRYAIRVLQHGASMIARANDVGGEFKDDGGRISVDSIDTTKLKVRHGVTSCVFPILAILTTHLLR